ncbi:multi-sensor signal transduction histidine kinase [Candidatus Vecturithrix granuli]|uniref:histidine kinase n=1 Tax=Vecturithrix granuli TaxID=1499967 RepID=A0A081BYD6_VECG1|nr:multi-sensor signal transduction histidine kinase [Candidatus Vecturithrix granuli]
MSYLIKDMEGNYLKTLPVTVEKALYRKQTEDALKTYQNHLEELVKERTAELETEILERKRIEGEVRTLNAELERRVEERTIELRIANQELLQSLETLRKAQEQLIQSEKMAALGGLVAGIAHEINTPVGVSITAASHLEQQTKEINTHYHNNTMRRSELEHYLDVAEQASRILLINLQLAADQIQIFKQVAVDQTSSERRFFNLKNYLSDVLLSLYPKLRNTRHTITINCPDTLSLDSYPGAFSQIVRNLVLNSLVHGFEHKEQGEITLDITLQAESLQLRYTDNGRGIGKEEIPKIFEPFYTTKRGHGGSGLGLNIVYNLVTQQLQGTIVCESQPGAGTTFLIQVPLSIS